MSLRNSVLICGSCLVLIFAITLVFSANYSARKTQIAKLGAANDVILDEVVPQTSQPEVRTFSVARQQSIDTVHRLRGLLKKRSELQRKQKTQLIHHLNERDKLEAEYAQLSADHLALQSDYDKLWQEADSSLMFLTSLLQPELASMTNAEAVGPNERDDSAVSEIALEPSTSEITGNADQIRLELEVVELELQQALGRISQLEDSAARMLQVSDSASMTLAEIGPTAVPFLMELLAEQEPEAVRTWAAWVLGNIGPTASEARGRLRELLVDANENLAKTAQDALDQIEIRAR